MRLLALDTSTDACSAALLIDGESTERCEFAPRRHAELILPMLESLLADAQFSVGDLDAIAFGRGPGAFTGLRIAAGVTQGIAFGADLPVVPVSSLAALGHRVWREQKCRNVIAAFDARIGEIYCGAYKCCDGSAKELTPESVGKADSVPLPPAGRWVGAGNGWTVYESELRERLGDRIRNVFNECYPHAKDTALLAVGIYQAGGQVAPEGALPVYLRNKVAAVKLR